MKILSITIHNVVNFGSVLQTYATQRIFELRGVDFCTLHYIPERLRLAYRLREIFLKGRAPMYKRIVTFLTMEVINKKVFSNFLKRRIKLTQPFYASDKVRIRLQADVYMTGSDQVWNSEHNRSVDTTYYWDFVVGKKVSFASSFGRSVLPTEEVNAISGYLHNYALLSVRENTGVKILKSIMGEQPIVQLLDPTLLLTGNQWRELAEEKNLDRGKKYVLIYPMSEVDPVLIEVAKKVADYIGAEVWMLSSGLKTYKTCNRTLKFQRPERFLSLIDNAECLVTNSFHGTAFAINFNTPFVSVAPKLYSTRIISLLTLLGLEDRLYSPNTHIDTVATIDFSHANRMLEKERAKANTYIDKILSLC